MPGDGFDHDVSPFGAGWEHAPPGSMGPAKSDPPSSPSRPSEDDRDRSHKLEWTRNSSSSDDSTTTSRSSGGGGGAEAGGGGCLVILLVVLGWIYWGNSGDPKKGPEAEQAKNVPVLAAGTYKVEGTVPVGAAGHKTPATLVGIVTLRPGPEPNHFIGAYRGDWGVGNAQGNVEAVQRGNLLELKVTTPGVGVFSAKLTHRPDSGRWMGQWANSVESGEFNISHAAATPNLREPDPASSIVPNNTAPSIAPNNTAPSVAPKISGTGWVVVRGKTKLASTVTAYVEVDGKRAADWPADKSEVKLAVPAGPHKVVLRSRARVIQKGRAVHFYFKYEFEVEVAGGKEEVKEIGKVEPDPNGRRYWP